MHHLIRRFRWRVALAIAMALVGCQKQQPASPQARRGTPENPWVVGMSQCNNAEPWRVQMNADIMAAAGKQPNIKVIIKDAQNKSSTQQDQVRELIRQKVDLLIISPKEARPLTRPVGEAMDAGIPVIVLDRAIEGDKYTCFIGADNVEIGREAGRYMVKLLGGKGSIVELKGLMTSVPGVDRHNGFMEGIKGSQIKILTDPDCEWLEEKAQTEMNSALTRFPKIDAVYGHNDPSAHGAYMAAKAEGKDREKTIRFIGIDALPHEGVKYVRQGILTATFEYPTGGKQAIDAALKILSGTKVPKKIVLGTRLFDRSNVEKGGEPIEPTSGRAGGRASPDSSSSKRSVKSEATTRRTPSVVPLHFYCPKCDAGFTVPVDEGRRLITKAVMDRPKTRGLVRCPKCAEYTCIIGRKCRKCGGYFKVPARLSRDRPPRPPDVCPKCWYRAKRERAIEAALQRKKAGTYDPNKVPDFMRRAVEEAEKARKPDK